MIPSIKLHKYRKCTQYAFDDLFNYGISFVSLSHFNDAMEGYIPYNKESIYETLSNKKSKAFYRFLIKNESKRRVLNQNGEFVEPFSKKPYKEQLEIVSSEVFKPRAIEIIDSFAKKLTIELRNSFLVSSFSETGGHPVMWSHYADDSSGFVEVFNGDLLENNFNSFVFNEFPFFTKEQLMVASLHKITYDGNKRNCDDFVIQFILHAYTPGEKDINKFMKYIRKTRDCETLIYILTNKMKEWQYEREWRLIIPRFITPKKRIAKDFAKEYISDYRSEPICEPEAIICGENMAKNNMAALAYYCTKYRNNTVRLSVQKRDSSIIEKRIMKAVSFSNDFLKRK